MDNNTFTSSSVNSALQRIKNTLAYSLRENYGITDEETINKFLKLHGLDKDRFDFINNFETLIEKGIADESVDANANKNDVSITGMFAETAMPINKLVGYRYLYRKLKDMYGKKRAKYLTGRMYDMSLALADSTNILKIYCWSVNASKLVYEGRPWGSLPSGIPHRVNSYVNALCETVHQLSNHLAGAIAIGSFQLDIAHIILYREHKTLSDIKNDNNYRKYIENSLQSFIHSVNMLSRNSVESPFTNISIHDRPKLHGLLDDSNMAWYFDKDDIVDGVPSEALADCGDRNWIEYVIDVISEIQEIYCDIMVRGDVLHDNRPIEFPVCTINVSRGTKEDGSYYFEDPEFVDNFCKRHDAPRYNIYVSEGSKVSSCCRLLSSTDMFTLGGQVNSFGGTALSLGSHRVLTINLRRIALECTDFEDYKKILKERMKDSADILVAHRALLRDIIAKGVQPFVSNGWIDLDKTFSTFGIMGYYEASKDLEARFGTDTDYLTEMVEFINAESLRLTAERNNPFNVEEIPGESMSYKLANSDRWIYGEEKVPEVLYANQFVPLWENATLFEKFDREGKLASKLTGGGIVHYSLGEKVTPSQSKYIIEKAMELGCEFFALNPVYSICENDHYTFGKQTVCPKCGGKITDYLTRTVGFFTKTSDWATPKRVGDFERRDYKGINE